MSVISFFLCSASMHHVHSYMFLRQFDGLSTWSTQPLSPSSPTSGRRSDCTATRQTPLVPLASRTPESPRLFLLLKWRPPPSPSISARFPYAPVSGIMEAAPLHLPNDQNEQLLPVLFFFPPSITTIKDFNHGHFSFNC
jgi:hypothetical protein